MQQLAQAVAERNQSRARQTVGTYEYSVLMFEAEPLNYFFTSASSLYVSAEAWIVTRMGADSWAGQDGLFHDCTAPGCSLHHVLLWHHAVTHLTSGIWFSVLPLNPVMWIYIAVPSLARQGEKRVQFICHRGDRSQESIMILSWLSCDSPPLAVISLSGIAFLFDKFGLFTPLSHIFVTFISQPFHGSPKLPVCRQSESVNSTVQQEVLFFCHNCDQ